MTAVAHTRRPARAPAPWRRGASGAPVFEWAAAFYAVAWAVHTGDHLRRGLDVVTAEVSVIGSVAGVLQVAGIAAVLLRRQWAPMAAVAIGFPDAIGIAAVHLLPHWRLFGDGF